MTDTPLFEETVLRTQCVPDPDSISEADRAEARHAGKHMVGAAMLRAFIDHSRASVTGRMVANPIPLQFACHTPTPEPVAPLAPLAHFNVMPNGATVEFNILSTMDMGPNSDEPSGTRIFKPSVRLDKIPPKENDE